MQKLFAVSDTFPLLVSLRNVPPSSLARNGEAERCLSVSFCLRRDKLVGCTRLAKERCCRCGNTLLGYMIYICKSKIFLLRFKIFLLQNISQKFPFFTLEPVFPVGWRQQRLLSNTVDAFGEKSLLFSAFDFLLQRRIRKSFFSVWAGLIKKRADLFNPIVFFLLSAKEMKASLILHSLRPSFVGAFNRLREEKEEGKRRGGRASKNFFCSLLTWKQE